MLGNNAGSVWTPKTDGTEVFRSELWHPSSQARTGVIADGTGTLTAGSPLVLQVGANTIDVAAAGTFIVTMPEGGTVASGTMTVSLSPVTILASIPTAITTTGGIGDITVTVADAFRSMDNNRYLMTNVGATWGKYGRLFDATDSDYIDVGTINPLPAGIGTISTWFKIDVAATYTNTLAMVAKGDDNTVKSIVQSVSPRDATTLRLILQYDATPVTYDTTVVASRNVWYNYTLVCRGNDTQGLFFNGELVASGSVTTMTPTAGLAMRVGKQERGAVYHYPFDGIIGETLLNTTPFTDGDVTRHYQNTKWRYES